MYSSMDSMATGFSCSPKLWMLKQIRRLLISTFVGWANTCILPVAKISSASANSLERLSPYVAKAEFVLSLCEQIMKKENVLPGDRSLIDRALRSIYKPLIESKYTAPCPTIKDLWAALNSQGGMSVDLSGLKSSGLK